MLTATNVYNPSAPLYRIISPADYSDEDSVFVFAILA